MAATLTNLQRELLGLFSTDLTDDELREVRTLLARHFADRATVAFDASTEARGLAPGDVDAWASGHERARTDRPGSAGDGA